MRKNMKKSAALLLAAMMTVSVTACGGGKTPDAPSDADLKKDVQEYICLLYTSDAPTIA